MSFPESYWAMVIFSYLLVRVLYTFQGLAVFLCVAYQILIFQNFGYHYEDYTEMFKQVQLITAILVVCGFRSNIVSPSDFNFFFVFATLGLHFCKGFLQLWCVGLSLWWLLSQQSTSSEAPAQCCGTRASLLCDLWNLPGSGIKPVSPALRDRFLTTGPSENSEIFFKNCICVLIFRVSHISLNLLSIWN